MTAFEVLSRCQAGDPLEGSVKEDGVIIAALTVDVFQGFVLFAEQCAGMADADLIDELRKGALCP